MPSAVGHVIVGATLAMPFSFIPALQKARQPAGFVLWSGLVAAARDLDTLFLLGCMPTAVISK